MGKAFIKGFFLLLAVAVLCHAGATAAYAQPVIAAYQKNYNMNFEVWHPESLPSGWYATFDGYAVAQAAPNHWVYGRAEKGALAPTSVAVGSVVPADIPELARVVIPLDSSGIALTPKFQSIALSGFNNIGVLGDPLAYTPIAWQTGRNELKIWLGDRWFSIAARSGETLSQALMNNHALIVRVLREKSILWTRSDTETLSYLSREWGMLWRGNIAFVSLKNARNDGSTEFTPVSVFETSTSITTTTFIGDTGQWDFGDGDYKDEDSGGWDSGGGTDEDGDGEGGGWDK